MPEFRPALLVIDVQNDFLPPDGSLAVKGGRDIIPMINKLVDEKSYDWSLVVFTQDWHPSNHTSFASNHPDTKPFTEMLFHNPDKSSESKMLTLWPDHCIQKSTGSQFGADLNWKDHIIIQKGTQSDREFYSAFSDVWHSYQTDLLSILNKHHISDIYICGLAYDYCVLNTAIDSAKLKFTTYVIEDICRSVDPSKDQTVTKRTYDQAGVRLITSASEELRNVSVR